MQLTQSYSSASEGNAHTTKPTAPSKKPKVPNKPSHLACIHRKDPSLPSASADETIAQKCASKHISHRKFPRYDERSKKEETRRRSTNTIVTSKQVPDVATALRFKSPTDEMNCQKRSNVVSADCCDFGEYVEINFPTVEPGTHIRTDTYSGEIETLPCCAGNLTPPTRERRKPTGRSVSDTSLRRKGNRGATSQQYEALISELGNKFRSNSLESLKPSSTADEAGYEIPLSLQTPTYMSLDEDLGPFLHDEVNFTDAKPKISRNKKIRLARFRRKPLNPNPSTSPDNISAQTRDKVDTDARVESSYETKNGFFPSPKPLNSFLATRLQSSSTDGCNGHHHHQLTNRTSLSSSTITCSTYESDYSEDEWSDSSEDDSAEYECFYQEIKSSSRPKRDHQYETIKEFPGNKNAKDNSKTKESRELITTCNDHKSSIEANVFHAVNLNAERKLYKKNFQDLKCRDVRDCTWDTVATPGVLKHSELKNVLRLNFSKSPFGSQRS